MYSLFNPDPGITETMNLKMIHFTYFEMYMTLHVHACHMYVSYVRKQLYLILRNYNTHM